MDFTVEFVGEKKTIDLNSRLEDILRTEGFNLGRAGLLQGNDQGLQLDGGVDFDRTERRNIGMEVGRAGLVYQVDLLGSRHSVELDFHLHFGRLLDSSHPRAGKAQLDGSTGLDWKVLDPFVVVGSQNLK